MWRIKCYLEALGFVDLVAFDGFPRLDAVRIRIGQQLGRFRHGDALLLRHATPVVMLQQQQQHQQQ